MPFTIIRNDITRVRADAIVNTANPEPVIGGGTDLAIYRAAGMEKLLAARKKIGSIKRGEACVTPAYDLPADFIIHTVGPVWQGGNAGEMETLASCYRKSLILANELGCSSIAFPLISSGVYGFPKDKALDIALREIRVFLEDHDMNVILVVFDRHAFDLSETLVDGVRQYIDEKYVEEHRKKEYGAVSSERRRWNLPFHERRPWGRPEPHSEDWSESQGKDWSESQGEDWLESQGEDWLDDVYGEELSAPSFDSATISPYRREDDSAKKPEAPDWGGALPAPPDEAPDWEEAHLAPPDEAPDWGGALPAPPDEAPSWDWDADVCLGAPEEPSEKKRRRPSEEAPERPYGKPPGGMHHILPHPRPSKPAPGGWDAAPQRPSSDAMLRPSYEKERAKARPAKPRKESYADRKLEDVIGAVGENFQQMLLRLIDERGLKDSDVYKKANLDRKLFSKIRCNSDYTPKKTTAIALAIALELTLDETVDLLARAGIALSPSSEFDLLIQYCIEHKMYDIFNVNILLFTYHQPLLGAVG